MNGNEAFFPKVRYGRFAITNELMLSGEPAVRQSPIVKASVFEIAGARRQ